MKNNFYLLSFCNRQQFLEFACTDFKISSNEWVNGHGKFCPPFNLIGAEIPGK